MKTQIGKVKMNKTWMYLLPSIYAYGPEFTSKINLLHKIAVGIGDMVLDKVGISYEQHLFILVDVKETGRKFKSLLSGISKHEAYEDDYAYDNLPSGRLHMIVVKIHPDHYRAKFQLEHSQFSKMYSQDEITKYFSNLPDIQKVLIKDHEYRLDFTDFLNHKFNTNIKPEEYIGELDLPTRKRNETF